MTETITSSHSQYLAFRVSPILLPDKGYLSKNPYLKRDCPSVKSAVATSLIIQMAQLSCENNDFH